MAAVADKEEESLTSKHSKAILKGLHALLLSREFADIQLVIKDKLFFAHRNVLASGSPYFHAMLTGGLMEKNQERIEVQGVEADIFEILLRFLYTGEVVITDETCQDLLAAADMFRLCDVIQECCAFLQKQLHPSNCLGIHTFADAHSCLDLALAAEKFICAHFLEVTKEEEYCQLPKQILIKFLNSENLEIESEYQVFEAAMRWILYHTHERRRLVFEVLNTVRFPVISQKKLERYIEDCPDLSLKIAVRKLVQDFRFDRRVSYNPRLIKPYLFKERTKSLKNIYVIGGYKRPKGGRWIDSQSLHIVECYKTTQHRWRAVPSLHFARNGHGVCILSGCMYAIGGESDSLIFDSAEYYDPCVDRWMMIPSMTMPRCGLGVAAVEDKIYAIGGWVGSQIGHTIERYDPVLNHWSHWDEVNMPRFAMGVLEVDGLIYIIGGISDVGTEMNAVESYNPITREWTRLADMLTKRAYVGVTSHNNEIYAVGGWADEKALDTVEKYSIDKNTWTYVSPLYTARAGTGVAAVNGLIYAIGGRLSPGEFNHSAPSTTDSVECYNTEVDTWVEVGPMPGSRCESGVVVL